MPTIIFLENHNDVYPKIIIKRLLSRLSNMGYKDFYVESDPLFSADQIISAHKEHLESCNSFLDLACLTLSTGRLTGHLRFNKELLKSMSFLDLSNLLRSYVSSRRYSEMAIGINGIIAYTKMLDVFSLLRQHKISLSGIDINSSQDKIVMKEMDLKLHNKNIASLMSSRDLALFNNLRLISQKSGIALLGIAHFKGVYELITKYGLQDKFIFCWPKGNGDLVQLCYKDLQRNLSKEVFAELDSAILDEKLGVDVNVTTIMQKVSRRAEVLSNSLRVKNIKLLVNSRTNQTINATSPKLAIDLLEMEQAAEAISTEIEELDDLMYKLKQGFAI